MEYLTNTTSAGGDYAVAKWARDVTPERAKEWLARMDEALARKAKGEALDTDEVVLSDTWRRPMLIKIVEHGAVDAVAGLLVEQLGATSKKEAMRKSAMAIKKYYNAQKYYV